MKKSIIYSIIILVLTAIVFFVLLKKDNKEDTRFVSNTSHTREFVSFKSSEYSPEILYPKTWGAVTLRQGNKTCPEEDTYRTQDTLHVYDWEYAFSEMKLPNSDSVIRIGVKLHELDPAKTNTCGNEFLLAIAEKTLQPEILSSVRLESFATKQGLYGIRNREASRLNTESRMQYTFFVKHETDRGYTILQPYMSFIPYAGSKELAELDTEFKGNMDLYIKEGKTAAPIRAVMVDFEQMVETMKFSGE